MSSCLMGTIGGLLARASLAFQHRALPEKSPGELFAKARFARLKRGDTTPAATTLDRHANVAAGLRACWGLEIWIGRQGRLPHPHALIPWSLFVIAKEARRLRQST